MSENYAGLSRALVLCGSDFLTTRNHFDLAHMQDSVKKGTTSIWKARDLAKVDSNLCIPVPGAEGATRDATYICI